MATKEVKVAPFVPAYKIAWLPKRNIRSISNYGDEKEKATLDEMLFPGWGQAFPCEIGPLSPEDKAEALASRLEIWTELKSQATTNADSAVRLQVFEELYVAGNKLREPEFLGNTGNRRGSRIVEVNFKRRKENQPTWSEVPVFYKHHESEASRRESQLFENLGKTAGNKNLDGREIVAGCYLLFKCGYTEAALGRTGLLRGTCQKLHRLYQLDREFPNLKIVERVALPDTDDKCIAWKPLDKEAMKTLLDCMDPKEAAKKERKVTDEQMVQDYVSGLSKKVVVKAMAKDDMQELGRNNPAKVIKDVVDSYLTNNIDGLFIHTECAESYNLTTEAHRLGCLPEMIKAQRRVLAEAEAKAEAEAAKVAAASA